MLNLPPLFESLSAQDKTKQGAKTNHFTGGDKQRTNQYKGQSSADLNLDYWGPDEPALESKMTKNPVYLVHVCQMTMFVLGLKGSA